MKDSERAVGTMVTSRLYRLMLRPAGPLLMIALVLFSLTVVRLIGRAGVLEIVWRSSVIAALSTAAGAVFDGVENVIMERRGRPKLLYSSRPALTDAQVLVGLLLSFATLAVFVSIDWDDPGSSPWLFVDGVLLIAGVLYWWWTIRGRSRGG